MKTDRQILEAEVVVQAFFDEMPDLDDGDRLAWNLRQGLNVCRWIAKTSGAMNGFTGILEELGEVPAWEFLADVADHSGYDVWNGDTLFEVYERGTVSATGRQEVSPIFDEGGEMPRQSVQDRIQKEMDKVEEKLRKLDDEKAALVAERTQLQAAKNALGSPTVTEADQKGA